jgi:DNA-directed RNA polymerase specialized sigma24 family protein
MTNETLSPASIRYLAVNVGGRAYAQAGEALEKGQPRGALAALKTARVGLDVIEREAVRMAREQGISWADISAHLGVTRQAAHHRYPNLHAIQPTT